MNKHSIKYFICFQTLRKQLHTRLKKLEVESQIAFDEMKTQSLFQTGLHSFGVSHHFVNIMEVNFIGGGL